MHYWRTNFKLNFGFTSVVFDLRTTHENTGYWLHGNVAMTKFLPSSLYVLMISPWFKIEISTIRLDAVTSWDTSTNVFYFIQGLKNYFYFYLRHGYVHYVMSQCIRGTIFSSILNCSPHVWHLNSETYQLFTYFQLNNVPVPQQDICCRNVINIDYKIALRNMLFSFF